MYENQLSERTPLDGIWDIEIAGKRGTLTVPGVWEVQGYPRDVTHATLCREIVVPAEWEGTQVILRAEAVSYDVTFKINGHVVGQHIGLWSSFEFDVSSYLQFGETNSITAEIIKPSNSGTGTYPYREVLVGFVSYISSTFGGIWQSIELASYAKLAWKNIWVQPNLAMQAVHVRAELVGADATTPSTLTIYDADGRMVITLNIMGATVDVHVQVPHIEVWSPSHPYLYRVELNAIQAQATRQFGFRQLQAQGHHLLLNGEPCFLRGILSWGWNPEHLAPTFSDAFIREEFQRVREQGFNLYKLCLYIPPENLFRIADEEGMLLWLEMPMWWQLDNPQLREQLPKEYAEIIARVQHHPSIVLVSLGCEIEGSMIGEGLIRQLEGLVRTQMDGILLCENSGSGEAYQGLTVDIADFYDYHFYSDAHYFEPMLQHFQRDWRTPRPWIFGEFAAQDDYRNPEKLVDGQSERLWWRDLLGTDGGIHRWAYSEQEARMQALALPFTHDELQTLSRKKSYALRKLILETTRRHAGMGGYVITGLRDTPISTSGIWDDELQPKYTADAMRQINNADVLLLDQGRRRLWVGGDRPYPQDVFNHWANTQADFFILFSGLNAPTTPLQWQFRTVTGEILVNGEQTIVPPPLDANPYQIARIGWTFPQVTQPIACELHVQLGTLNNTWRLWVYPQVTDWLKDASVYDPSGCLGDLERLPAANLAQPNGTIIASVLTKELETAIEAGTNVVLLQTGNGTLPAKRVAFWQEALNLVLTHPLWDSIPHQGVTTEQFYHVATGYAFDPAQSNYHSLLRRLHTRLFTTTDLIIEKQIGKGRLLATTLNLLGGEGNQAYGLDNNVFGTYLLAKMVHLLNT